MAMAMATARNLLLLATLCAIAAPASGFATRIPTSGTLTRSRIVAMSSAQPSKGAEGSADLVAAAQQSGGDPRRVAVSGLVPQSSEQQQQYAGVPPPGSTQAPPPTFIQKARAPFMGVTFLATAAVAAWQSNRMFKTRQSALIDDFAATMVVYLGDEREMNANIQSFRSQLGPGRYTAPMFVAFLKAVATDVPIGVSAIQNVKAVAGMFRLTDAAAAKLLETAASDLSRQPSVLGTRRARALPSPAPPVPPALPSRLPSCEPLAPCSIAPD